MMHRLHSSVSLACLALLGAACHGEIGDGDPSTLDPDAQNADPGPMDLRRLTDVEVTNSVRDVLGVEPAGLPEEVRAEMSPTGFRNASGPQTINLAHAERYYAAAEEVAEAALAQKTGLFALTGCDVEQDGAPCVQTLAERAARRLFRRPVDAEEVASLVALTANDTTPRDAAKTILIAILTSPRFLWKVEIGVPKEDGFATLTGFERASRLSFFLVSSGPDEELLQAAEAGALDTPEGVAEHTRRLLRDPRAEPTLRAFVREWLLADRLGTWARSSELFPLWGDQLKAEMEAEVEGMAMRHLREGDALGMFIDSQTEIGPTLASLYGFAGPGTVDLSTTERRGGILSLAGFLTASNRFDWTSSIHRGVFVREQVFCAPVSPPPDPVPAAIPAPGQDASEVEEAHTAEEPCKSCHRLLDPIGHGLERYDAIGQLRQTYPSGKPVREDGEIVGISELETTIFTDAKELGAIAYSGERVAACLAAQVFRFALGRVEQAVDAPVIEASVTGMSEAGGAFEELVVRLTTSKAFLTRRMGQ
jgi:hypothetical protein